MVKSSNIEAPVPPTDFLNLPFTNSLNRKLLDLENKTRSNSLAWRGQFSPQLIELFLRSYSSPDCKILDPFLGSGTVLCEAGRLQLEAYGCEINPAAYFFANFYSLINTTLEVRLSLFDRVHSLINDYFFDSDLFFGKKVILPEKEIKAKLIAIYQELKNSLEKLVIETLIVSLDFFKPGLSLSRVFDKLKYLRDLALSFPFSRKPLKALLSDARELPFPDNYFDFVVSSPPYINVFNYHQQYRSSTESLGWDLISVAHSEIGSNRKFRQNRFYTVVQYCLDIFLALQELNRVCQKGAKIIFVIGRESNVKKTPFYNGDLFKSIATQSGMFELLLAQERVFKNKFGQFIFEDIFHFSKVNKSSTFSLTTAKSVAHEALVAALSRVPPKEKEDLEQAILAVNNIKPSPIFSPSVTNSRPHFLSKENTSASPNPSSGEAHISS